MSELTKWVNTELQQGFTVSQVAEKHACPVGLEDSTGGWTEPMVWSIALKGKSDLDRFKALNWGLRTLDKTILLHPHIHCLVTGGGLTDSKEWEASTGSLVRN